MILLLLVLLVYKIQLSLVLLVNMIHQSLVLLVNMIQIFLFLLVSLIQLRFLLNGEWLQYWRRKEYLEIPTEMVGQMRFLTLVGAENPNLWPFHPENPHSNPHLFICAVLEGAIQVHGILST